MSQKYVELIIGRLVTDEAFRQRFSRGPDAELQDLITYGVELTPYEQQALQKIDLRAVNLFASTVDPCLQKSNFERGNK